MNGELPGNAPVQTQATIHVPPGQMLKTLAGDPRTTNLLLGILVLCMSGLMPEQLNTLCS